MQNIVKFIIIRRPGRINAAKNAALISVATNYNRSEGETWNFDPLWHRIALFSGLRERLEKDDRWRSCPYHRAHRSVEMQGRRSHAILS